MISILLYNYILYNRYDYEDDNNYVSFVTTGPIKKDN